MPPMSGPMATVEWRRTNVRGQCAAGLAGALLLFACSPEDGIVGAMVPDDAGVERSEVTFTFETEFDVNDGLWEERVVLPGGSVEFGSADSDARDGNVARLRFPGDRAAESRDHVGPEYVTQIRTFQRFHFGTYRTRVQLGTCAPGEEVATALLGYFGDGSDGDGDTITDELEITIQFLCGTPQVVFLTVFTDYEVDSSGAEQFEKLTRAVDFSTGDIYDTPSAESHQLVLTDASAEFLQPGFPAPNAYYELGFEWQPGEIRFFVVLEGTELSLWTLNDPARIPQQPVHFMYNLWHPGSHWYPALGSADFPAQDVTLGVDWLRIRSE